MVRELTITIIAVNMRNKVMIIGQTTALNYLFFYYWDTFQSLSFKPFYFSIVRYNDQQPFINHADNHCLTVNFHVMETLKNIKTELHHVFVDGDAKSWEIAHVLVLLDIPLMFVVLLICQFV